jgi:hypothetical protein
MTTTVEYEMNEALKAELAEAFAENDLLKARVAAAEQGLEVWKKEVKKIEYNATVAVKAAEARAKFALQTQKDAEARAVTAEMQLKTNTAYWKTVADKANLRAAAAMAEKQKTSDPEERVLRALKNALTPLSKLKIMAQMVGVGNLELKEVAYIKLKKKVLMIVHEDRRPKNATAETIALYECICRIVNGLPSV